MAMGCDGSLTWSALPHNMFGENEKDWSTDSSMEAHAQKRKHNKIPPSSELPGICGATGKSFGGILNCTSNSGNYVNIHRAIHFGPIFKLH